MKKRMKKISMCLFLILISSWLSGCGDDALSSLKSNEVSATYDKAYWQNEKKSNSDKWQKAVAICNESMSAALTPNCQVLADVADQRWAVPKMPKYGSGQGFNTGFATPSKNHQQHQ